ncbi:MAG: peroxide stress protein YaaA [Bacteroidota bacterium]
MIILLSPAKTLDFSKSTTEQYTKARLLSDSKKLIKVLKKKTPQDLQSLMNISEKLAEENFERYHQFSTPFNLENAKQAVLAFKGDVYQGLEAGDFTGEDLEFAQQHLRILSGLYGVLRPMDLMQPYRLEMGTRLAQNGSKNLYEFWDKKITKILNKDLKESGGEWIVNLASNEYFKSVKKDQLKGKLLNIDFKENRDGKYKTIAFNAKKARGAMSRQIIKHRLNEVEAIKSLIVNDYIFNQELSNEQHFIFTK